MKKTQQSLWRERKYESYFHPPRGKIYQHRCLGVIVKGDEFQEKNIGRLSSTIAS